MNTKELIEAVLEGIAEDMIKDQNAKHMRASGASSESFHVDATSTEGNLTGAAHWYWQIHGRKPGPFKDGIETMLMWIKRKGIQPKDKNTSLRSLAFLFARKISLEGNDIFLGKRAGIGMDAIIKKWVAIFKSKFKDSLKTEIKSILDGAINPK
jgi:hypothetical protein